MSLPSCEVHFTIKYSANKTHISISARCNSPLMNTVISIKKKLFNCNTREQPIAYGLEEMKQNGINIYVTYCREKRSEDIKFCYLNASYLSLTSFPQIMKIKANSTPNLTITHREFFILPMKQNIFIQSVN